MMNDTENEHGESVAIVAAPYDVEATDQPFGQRWGGQVIALNDGHIQALKDGKFIAVDVQSEYVVFLQLEARKE
jgi:hypothetical protein